MSRPALLHRATGALALVGLLATTAAPALADTARPGKPTPAAAVNDFAFDLLARLHTNDGNLAFSPASIVLALGMVHGGARGRSADDLERVLHLPGNARRAQASLVELHAQLAELSPARGAAPGAALSIASGVWMSDRLTPSVTFRDLLRHGYAAAVSKVDFRASPAAARDRINTWIDDHTAHRIPELLPTAAIEATTQLVLASAVHFAGAWSVPFDPARTTSSTFTTAAGARVEVPFMQRSDGARWARTEQVQLLELPYAGDRLVMDVIMPSRGALPALERTLSAKRLAGWLGQLRHVDDLHIALPRFTLRTPAALSSPLTNLGLGRLFSSANLAGMFAGRAPKTQLGEVFHETWVVVDEHGTEGAAATAVVIRQPSAPPSFVADRPFLFLIRDTRSGAILFMGRVADPR